MGKKQNNDYVKIAQDDVELVSVGLKEINGRLFKDGKSNIDGRVEIAFRFAVKEPCESEKARFDFLIRLDLKLSGKDKEGENIFELMCTVNGGFKCHNEKLKCTETFEELSHLYAQQIFPVARTYATDLINKMGLRSVYLPWSFRAAELKKEEADPE